MTSGSCTIPGVSGKASVTATWVIWLRKRFTISEEEKLSIASSTDG